MKTLTVIGVHGLGDHRESTWATDWERTLRASLPTDARLDIAFAPFNYDDIFDKIKLSTWDYLVAFKKLSTSGLGGLFSRQVLPARGPVDSVNNWLKWYAGYVVGWVENEQFRAEVRQRFLTALEATKPDLLLAHSLGTLITYDALCDPGSLPPAVRNHLGNMVYVTLGSQLANPFVVRNLAVGRLDPLAVRHWYHLYNREDDVFTAQISLPGADNFQQVTTFFDIEGFADHDALEYLKHDATINNVWTPLRNEAIAADTGVRTFARAADGLIAPPATLARKPRRRAVLVGINDYPDPANQLHGCVNDVFLMSAVLQECEFSADDIRVVLNSRATAAGILDRMEWLLSDAAPEDELVFFYSGHGAQLPTYGEADTVDRMDETLVPYDFNWSPQTAVTDDQIFRWYSQLPYDTRLVMIFDCCHSGGMHRDAGLKVRGLEPPDDIRHRALYWDPKAEMWRPRPLKPIAADFSPDPTLNRQFFGSSGSVARLGRAATLRQVSAEDYDAAKKENRNRPTGPYLPMIVEACREDQLSYEYRHGVQSYGAFTYTLAALLRRLGSVSFKQLVEKTRDRLEELGFNQTPTVLGPKKLVQAKIPWVRPE